MFEEEEKYRKTRSILKSLPKIKAPGDFESKLFHRIRTVESERLSSPSFKKLESAHVSKGWLSNILRPAFIPAAGLAVIVVIAILLYVHNLSMNNNSSPQITQSVTQNEQDMKKQPTETQKEFIAKDEEVQPNKEGLLKRELTERPSGPKLSESDFESTPVPVPPPSMLESKTAPTEEQSIDRLSEPKDEKKSVEKKSDELKGVEKKGAPENIRKEDESDHNGDIFQKVMPSVIEGKMRASDTIKLDSTKIKSLKKKENKLINEQNDSVKVQQEQEEKQPDSTKNN